MLVEVRAEYACGHAPRVIARGECRAASRSADLKRLIESATVGGVVNFNCPCGRGAAYAEILADGKVIRCTPASAFLGVAGARVSRVPRAGG